MEAKEIGLISVKGKEEFCKGKNLEQSGNLSEAVQ